MAISTQLRLIQVTGSLGTGAGQLDDTLSAEAKADISAADVSGLMSAMASSLVRLHGASSFSENATGVLDHSSQIVASSSLASSDAIKLYTSNAAGGIYLDAPGSTGAIEAAAGLIVSMSAAGASSNAIDINASDDDGGILMRAGTGGLDVNVVGGAAAIDAAGVSIDGSAASNFATSAGALTLTSAAAATWSTTAGALTLDGAAGVSIEGNAGEVDVTTTGAVDINSAGAITVDSSAAGISLDSSGASNFTADGGALTLSTANSGQLIVTSAEDVDINGPDGVTIDSVAAGVSIDAQNDSNFSTTIGALLLTGANGVKLKSTDGTLHIDGSGQTCDLDFGVLDQDALSMNFDTSAGTIQLTAGGTNQLGLTGSYGVNVLATNGPFHLTADSQTVNIDAGGEFLMDAAAGMSLDAGAASNFTTSAGAITIDAEASTLELNGHSGVNIVGNAAEVDITTTGAVDINSAAGTWDSSAGISLDADGSSNFVTTTGYMQLGGRVTLMLSSSSGNVGLSGSQGVAFATDGGYTFTGQNDGGLKMMDAHSEASTYRSNFSATTSVLAAINTLYSSISNTEATLFRRGPLTGSDGLPAGFPVLLAKVAGDSTTFDAATAPNKLDVYVNGQLLVSGTEAARSAGTVDYSVSAATTLKMAFALSEDDVVTGIDRS